MKTTNTKKLNTTKLIFIITTVVVLIVCGWLFYTYKTQIWPFSPPQTITDQTNEVNNINYSPPSEQEIDSSQDGKKNNSGQSEETPIDSTQENSKRKVSVGIAFANYDPDEKAVDIRAFTPDAIEGDGECTATLTQGSKTVTQSSEAFIDSSSSQCEAILIPASKFGSGGTWKLSVSYTSSKSIGTSPTMEVSLNI